MCTTCITLQPLILPCFYYLFLHSLHGDVLCNSLAAFSFNLKDSTMFSILMVIDSVCYLFFWKIRYQYFWMTVLLTFGGRLFLCYTHFIDSIIPVSCGLESLLRTLSLAVLEVSFMLFASFIILISGSLRIIICSVIMIMWVKFLLCQLTFWDLIVFILFQI